MRENFVAFAKIRDFDPVSNGHHAPFWSPGFFLVYFPIYHLLLLQEREYGDDFLGPEIPKTGKTSSRLEDFRYMGWIYGGGIFLYACLEVLHSFG